jgi:protein-S-isoprenylcysteine O-methyltransferase
MTIAIIAALVQATWLAFEWRGGFITVEKPWGRASIDANRDRHSSTMWDLAATVELVGLVLGFLGVGRIAGHKQLVALSGLGMLGVGILVRWTAIRTLGAWFTGVVRIHREHRLIRHGLYRYLRHPSYTGALLAHLGLGAAFVSWVSLACSTCPFVVAALYRIRVEERALREVFGDQYVSYSAHTWRLVPFVY